MQTVVLMITFITTRWQPNIPNIVSYSKLILNVFAGLPLERLLVLKGKQNKVYEESSAYNRQGEGCKVEWGTYWFCYITQQFWYSMFTFKMLHLQIMVLGSIHFKYMRYIDICLILFSCVFCLFVLPVSWVWGRTWFQSTK